MNESVKLMKSCFLDYINDMCNHCPAIYYFESSDDVKKVCDHCPVRCIVEEGIIERQMNLINEQLSS